MEYKILRKENWSLAAVVKQKEDIASIQITVDLHDSNSVKTCALESFYTEALLSGCDKHSRESFHRQLGLLGASIDVSIYESRLHFRIRTITENANKVLALFSDMMSSPSFETKEFKRIVALRTNELRDEKEDAEKIAAGQLANQFYTPEDRRYSFAPDSVIKEIEKVSGTDLQELHEKVMSRFWYCSLAGEKKLAGLVEKTLVSLKHDAKPASNGVHKQVNPSKHLVLKDVPSKHNIEFSIGATMPFTLHHPDLPAFLFGLNVLGYARGFSGRLMSTVREKEGLTYGIYAVLESVGGTELGYWRVGTFFAPDKAEQGLRSTLREINQIRTKGVSAAEFSRFKSILKTEQLLLEDSLTRALRELHRFHIEGFNHEEITEYKQKIMNVSLKEVNLALKKYLNPKTIVISGAGPISKVQKDLAKLLKN